MFNSSSVVEVLLGFIMSEERKLCQIIFAKIIIFYDAFYLWRGQVILIINRKLTYIFLKNCH